MSEKPVENVRVYLIPSTELGHVEDVMPEKIRSQELNDWVGLSREILKKKRLASDQGEWRSPQEIGEEHKVLNPFGAEYCPALHEASSFGFLLKWPMTAIFKSQ